MENINYPKSSLTTDEHKLIDPWSLEPKLLVNKLKSSVEEGLSSTEAKHRRLEFGKN